MSNFSSSAVASKNIFRKPTAAILTFHNTPNYGATLQCYALSEFLKSSGLQVEVINYTPLHSIAQYIKSLFFGKRRSFHNIKRVFLFYRFVKHRFVLSGNPIIRSGALLSLREKNYDIAFVGSDEVWKVDHMRNFDTSYYFDFLDSKVTKLVAYAATASMVTDLRTYRDKLVGLLQQFSGIGVRDRWTYEMIEGMIPVPPVEVLDPTLIHDFSNIDLPPHPDLIGKRYVAVYSWLDGFEMDSVRAFAERNGLMVVCVGCRHSRADLNLIGVGPNEWMSLIKNSSAVVTDFFHGVLFSIIFKRPFFAHVDQKKKIKLQQALNWAGLSGFLHDNVSDIKEMYLAEIEPDWSVVSEKLAPLISNSQLFIREQIGKLV